MGADRASWPAAIALRSGAAIAVCRRRWSAPQAKGSCHSNAGTASLSLPSRNVAERFCRGQVQVSSLMPPTYSW